MKTQFSARLPIEIVVKIRNEARLRHSNSTAVVLEALEWYFAEKERRGLQIGLRAALILSANAISDGDKDKAVALRRAALEIAEKEITAEQE